MCIIYIVGLNHSRLRISQKYSGVEFMNALVADMTQQDPAKRPTMDEVVERFNTIRQKLSWWKLRGRLVRRRDGVLKLVFFGLVHIFRTASYVVRRIPPVPDYTTARH